ncbi:unnamed protein product [Anisakis simplex]|uniref:PRY domain-containing protein n=1 Tax=Anisakis simplex TaxID=6269 RepID=A0A0M3JYZ1_ANISI|nr:unnamed protein product [Anisakis simplex]
MLLQREDAERSDLFEYSSMNYGCLSELSCCYRIDALIKMCDHLANIAVALHKSLSLIGDKTKLNGTKMNQLLNESIKCFRITNAIAEIFSITPLPKSKLPDEGKKFQKYLNSDDEMDFLMPTNEGLQIVSDPEQYIPKFESQIDHMRSATNEIGRCLITITRIIRSVTPNKELVNDVTEHKIEILLDTMPPSCGEIKRIKLSPFSAKLLGKPPKDKPCMRHLTVEDDPCLLVEELYAKLCRGEKVWNFEKGPFVR